MKVPKKLPEYLDKQADSEQFYNPLDDILECLMPIHNDIQRDIKHIEEIKSITKREDCPSLAHEFEQLCSEIEQVLPLAVDTASECKPRAFVCKLYRRLYVVFECWRGNHRDLVNAMMKSYVKEINGFIKDVEHTDLKDSKEATDLLQQISKRTSIILQLVGSTKHIKRLDPNLRGERAKYKALSHLRTTVELMREAKPGYDRYLISKIHPIERRRDKFIQIFK